MSRVTWTKLRAKCAGVRFRNEHRDMDMANLEKVAGLDTGSPGLFKFTARLKQMADACVPVQIRDEDFFLAMHYASMLDRSSRSLLDSLHNICSMPSHAGCDFRILQVM